MLGVNDLGPHDNALCYSVTENTDGWMFRASVRLTLALKAADLVRWLVEELASRSRSCRCSISCSVTCAEGALALDLKVDRRNRDSGGPDVSGNLCTYVWVTVRGAQNMGHWQVTWIVVVNKFDDLQF